jgi:hypothetical protein
VGIPSVFLSSARPALFAGALLTDIGDSDYRETYYNFGLQLDLSFTIAHRHPMTLSLGYAQGYVDGDKADDEVMFR